MWSYVMAAARGDSRRRPGSIFTVHSASACPGPCRDGFNSSFYRDGRDRPIRQATYPPYFRDAFKDDGEDGVCESQIHKATEDEGGAPAEVKIISALSENSKEDEIKKKASGAQDQQRNTFLSTVRGRLANVAQSFRAAIRFRGYSKSANRPPDWFVDKSQQEEDADKDPEPAPTCCGRQIVVDTSKPYHYKPLPTSSSNSKKARCPLASDEDSDLYRVKVQQSSPRLLPSRDGRTPSQACYTTPGGDPSHVKKLHKWLMVVSLAVLYNVVFVIGRAVFWELNNAAPLLWWILDYVCDLIYFLDILIRAHEGYLEQGLLVTDPKKLRRNYFSKNKWRSDFLSLVPTDFAYIWLSPYDCNVKVPCPVIVRLNRLIKLPRMWEWFGRTETNTNYPNVFRICKVVLAILVLIHWNACLYFAISYAIGFSSDNWVYNIDGPVNSTLTRQYIYSFYWSTLTLTTIGETPVPENDAEYLFVVANFLAGVLIFATIVGNIGSMISNMNLAKVDFQNRMDGVKQYMAFRKVGRELESRVIRWFAYTWEESGALDEERVLSALPDKLKAEIAIKVHLDTLRKVRIFQDCEPGLLEALVLKLKLQVFSPKDYICRKGDVGKEMYIVKRGRLQVVADDGKTVLATLGAGSVFGEVSVLEIAGNRTGNRRTANVRSLGYSDLFCLAKEDLWQTLADYPEARASLMERGCQLLRKDGLLDEEVFRRAKQEQESVEQAVKRLETTVETLQTRVARLLAEFTASQAKLKQRLTRVEARRHNEHNETTKDGSTTPSARRRLRSLEVKRNPNFDDISRHKTM